MRLLENYVSIQGEGPNVGKPTRFIRFAGCNLRCPGWPCDTQHAIEPSLYSGKFVNYAAPEDLVEYLSQYRYPSHVCLTGGEPFLQKGFEEFVDLLARFYSIDIFTNGTFDIPEWMTEYTQPITIVMDWKLPGSGEEGPFPRRIQNARRLNDEHAIKFVVKDNKDLNQAYADFIHLVNEYGVDARFYVGAVWGQITDAEIVDFITNNELPWYLNVQQHKHIWSPEEILR